MDPASEIYNQYPMEELIIHPRIQTDFYKNTRIWKCLNMRSKTVKIHLLQWGYLHERGI